MHRDKDNVRGERRLVEFFLERLFGSRVTYQREATKGFDFNRYREKVYRRGKYFSPGLRKSKRLQTILGKLYVYFDALPFVSRNLEFHIRVEGEENRNDAR